MLSNCKKDDKCIDYKQAPVTATNTPATGIVNQDIAINVSFGCTNGCGQFGKLEETTQGNIRTIKITAKYEGCTCIMIAPILQTTYKFRTSNSGTYYLKFLQNDNVYLIDTLTIQ